MLKNALHSIRIQIETFSPKNYTKELNVFSFNLYPQRQFKFPECKLNIATYAVEPFVIIENLTNGTVTFRGVDVIIATEIARKLNLTPIYMQAPDTEKRGIIFPNGTATGSIKLV